MRADEQTYRDVAKTVVPMKSRTAVAAATNPAMSMFPA